MSKVKNPDSTRGRGRPRTDPTPNWSTNPAFRRVRAAERIQAELFLAACKILNGEDRKEVEVVLRRHLSAFPTSVRGLKASEQQAFAVRAPCASMASPEAIRKGGGPEKWADAQTGVLVGHGWHWYKDAVRRSPWPPGKRRRYSPVAEMRREMKRHPSHFDGFTAEERCFLRLPAEARNAIEAVVRDALQSEREKWRRERPRDFPIVDYFERGPKARRSLGVPPSLRDIVWGAVGHLDKELRAAVRTTCRRYFTKGRKDAGRLTGKAVKVDADEEQLDGRRLRESDAAPATAWLTGEIVRDYDSPDDNRTGGGQRRNYVDVTPLPALGRLSD